MAFRPASVADAVVSAVLIWWLVRVVLVRAGWCRGSSANPTWFVAGDHWYVPTRIRSQTNAAFSTSRWALPTAAWTGASSCSAVGFP